MPHTPKYPPCPLAKKCGGCQLQHMPYAQQLQYKQDKVNALLGRYHRVSPICGMSNPYHYRNKVQAAFALTRNREILSGVYQSSSHRIVKVDSCQIEDPVADRIVVSIRRLLPEFQILPYQEDSRKGFLRHVLVRRGFKSGQIMVVLVAAHPIFSMKKRFVQALLERHPEITTVVLNINSQKTSMVLGEREEVLYGKGYIEDTLCGCVFRISPRSFYQINPIQTEVLYGKAIELAGLTGTENVLDAYCGIGTIGLIAARTAGQVVGVEVNGDAVRDARVNAKRNGITNAHFITADAGEYMVELAQEGQPIDVVFMDPPRAGSDMAFLNSLVTLHPKKVIYISCNPETQARDLRTLTKNGYCVTHVQPVDMFPHTQHIECIVALEDKQGADR